MNLDRLKESTAPEVNKAKETRRPGSSRGGSRRAWRVLGGLLILLAVAAAFRFTVMRPPLVSVAEVKHGNVTAEVEGTGTVTADVLANIASKITGRVEQVFVDEADTVRKGHILATLDQTDLQRQVESARARLAGAQEAAQERQREWDREKTLLASGAVSTEDAQQYQERNAVAQSAVHAAEADVGYAEYNLSLTRITSLSSGIVTKRWVNLGDAVVAGQPMFTVADTGLIYVNTYIDQSAAGEIKKDEPASVVLRGREDHPLSGHVLRISPQADPATEEMVAEVAFKIPNDEFQLGQWANVYVQVGEAKDALVVPRAALMPMPGETSVFVVDAKDKIHQEPVTVLARSPRRPMVAVAGHLSPGDRVVLMPMGLHPGETVRIAPVKEAQAEMPMP